MTPIRRHAVMLAAAAAASPAPACLPWTSVQPSTPGNSNNVLASVAVLSPGNVWAAGSYDLVRDSRMPWVTR